MLTHLLIRKLELFEALAPEDKQALEGTACAVTYFAPNMDLASQGDQPEQVYLVLEGWAGRYKVLSNGERQILAYLIAGDLCDAGTFRQRRLDHSIGTLSHCKVVSFSRTDFVELLKRREAIARGVSWISSVDEAILREWLLSMGRRVAQKRLAHLLCEMLLRCRAAGLVQDNGFAMPLNQRHLADMMGLSDVHMNRSLNWLRRSGLITMQSRRIVINHPDRLMQFAEFDPDYLHELAHVA